MPTATRKDWGTLEDLDVKYAFEHYGGNSIKEFYPRLKYAVDAGSERQAFYEADVNIYENFVDTRREIEAATAVV